MLKKTITYTDFDGNQRTEDHYFNLTETELVFWQMETPGGLKAKLEQIMVAGDTPKLMMEFKDIIKRTYGRKSADGRKFEKSDEITQDFMSSLAYNEFIMEMVTSDTAASDFINAVVPDIEKRVEQTKQSAAV